MLKQLKQAVSSAVSSDPLKDYALDESSAMKVGRGNMFVVYAATLRATGQPVSVFTLPLKELAARCSSAGEMAYVVDAVRKGVAQLAQLRHPRILRVEHGLVEDKKRLWYATERVTEALSLRLPLSDMPTQLKVLELRQCGEAMRFVHEKADVLLVNFAPHSLYVTADGQWKLGDLVHARPRSELAALSTSTSLSLAPFSFRSMGAPLLDYMAYEYVDHVCATQGSSSGGGSESGGSSAQRRSRHGSSGSGATTAAAAPSSLSQQQQQHVDALSDLFGARDAPLATTTTTSAATTARTTATAPSQPLRFPDSDVFAFVLVAVEVLASRRLFSCLGDPAQQQRQRRDVEATVAQYFAPAASAVAATGGGGVGSLLQLPRPPLSSVLSSGPFATPDVQLLLTLHAYDTLDARERFALLRGIYNGLGAGLFCEPVIMRHIVPRMKREGALQQQQQQGQQDMLRYTLPVLLQCATVLSPAAFDACLCEYMTALVAALCRATAFDARVQVLAQQILEKFTVFARHFAERIDDVNAVVLPLLLKCLSCSDVTSNSSNSSSNNNVSVAACNNALTRLALEALHSVLQRYQASALHIGVVNTSSNKLTGNDAAHASSSSRVVVPLYVVDMLIRIAARPGGVRFAAALDCLDVLLPRLSLAAREGAEEALLRALATLVTDDVDTSDVAAAAAADTFVHRMLAMLQSLQAALSPEHVATCTIPRVCPLLLSRHTAVRQYAVQCIVQCAQRFGNSSSSNNNNNSTLLQQQQQPQQRPATNADLLAAFGLT